MRKCEVCLKDFSPEKTYYRACPECANKGIYKCKKCGRAVFPANGSLRCCGVEETVKHAEYVERYNTTQIARALTKAGIFNQEDYLDELDSWDQFD